MTERDGLLKSFEVLGNQILNAESDLNYERLCKNRLAEDVERLEAENGTLKSKLSKVEAYIEQIKE